MKAKAVIPSKRNRKVFIPHDTAIYKHRNQIERCFGRLKHFPRLATRYDRRTVHFSGFVHLAAAMIWLRKCRSDLASELLSRDRKAFFLLRIDLRGEPGARLGESVL